jgi:hypothetical protein
MQKTIFKTIFASAVLLASTQLNAQTKTAKNTGVQSAVKTVALDLSSTGINAMIQVPEGVAIIPDKYNVLIGNSNGFLIQIEEAYSPFSEKVTFTKDNSVRGFVKFIKQDETSYIAEMNPFGSQKEYDFAYFVTLNGTNYILQDPGTAHNLNVNEIEEMLKMAISIKAK